LVAQDEDPMADPLQGGLPGRLPRRQASEQWRTSAQFFAQRFRQVMGRPQAAQGLDGKPALLPAKGRGMAGVWRIGMPFDCVS
jgi:hypothetical protein